MLSSRQGHRDVISMNYNKLSFQIYDELFINILKNSTQTYICVVLNKLAMLF